MRYINRYASQSSVKNAIDAGTLSKPYVAYVEDDQYIDWNTYSKDYSLDYLTFEILSNGNIIWKTTSSGNTKTIEYKKNNGAWTSITSTTDGVQIPVVEGDIVKFRGNNATYANDSNYNTFSGTTCQFNLSGNIMSLINSTGFTEITALTSTNSNCFDKMFRDCSYLKDASNLVLPATTLAWCCYYGMFSGCTSLVNAPVLSATTLAYGCYYYMFESCTSLENGPSSIGTSATTMATSACTNMFSYCTSLTKAPELPATTLTKACYRNMFLGCTSLNYVKCLARDISAEHCTTNWLANVAATGRFVTPSTTNWQTGDSGIPTNWTRVNS